MSASIDQKRFQMVFELETENNALRLTRIHKQPLRTQGVSISKEMGNEVQAKNSSEFATSKRLL